MEKPEQDVSSDQNSAGGAAGAYALQEWIDAGKPASASVVVAGEDDLADHYATLLRVPQITITFAGFMDGRGFSHAGKLRQMGFDGKLVAGGEVLADQWVYLQRCGFDTLESVEVASNASALPGFTEVYQADARELEPLFRRKRQV
ncbi:MAG: hypothetical protein ACI8RN_003004 [Glaciecola sp.]|jgi:uncharacterized protein (DUF934 family)|uniref:DUF934 domain-containing protein n=1 Tax=Congregibacter sp. TaxID=2744308 RepID=UPI0039E40E63